MKKLGIAEFKAKCIDTLKTIEKTGEPLLVTHRQRPLATVYPYREETPRRELGKLKGRIQIHSDIVRGDFDGEWEMEP